MGPSWTAIRLLGAEATGERVVALLAASHSKIIMKGTKVLTLGVVSLARLSQGTERVW